jgi:hypothetical protein
MENAPKDQFTAELFRKHIHQLRPLTVSTAFDKITNQ